MSPAIAAIKEPRLLAGLAAKLPAVFVRDGKTAERFLGFLRRISETETRGGHITTSAAKRSLGAC